jgi:hypothetical protein
MMTMLRFRLSELTERFMGDRLIDLRFSFPSSVSLGKGVIWMDYPLTFLRAMWYAIKGDPEMDLPYSFLSTLSMVFIFLKSTLLKKNSESSEQ